MEKNAETGAAAVSHGKVERKCALVVDDNVYLRTLISIMLSRIGFQVVQAGDGSQALAEAGRRRVDLLVTDLNMPVMDGFTLINRIQGLKPEMPIVIITGETQDRIKEISRQTHVFAVLPKPFGMEELQRIAAGAVSEGLRA